jgi:hypothetical protein
MSPRKHVVITGTGRSGTTFLVELLTHLGLDTGFTPENLEARKYEIARAGLEHDIRWEKCPYIVKKPRFNEYAQEVLDRGDIVIEHVFVPMRDLFSAAESRRFVEKSTLSQLSFVERMAVAQSGEPLPGGLWRTTSVEPGEQEKVLLEQIYELLYTLSNTSIPLTLLRFPRIVHDCTYVFEKLQPILAGITYERFAEAFATTARPELVHRFDEKDR